MGSDSHRRGLPSIPVFEYVWVFKSGEGRELYAVTNDLCARQRGWNPCDPSLRGAGTSFHWLESLRRR